MDWPGFSPLGGVIKRTVRLEQHWTNVRAATPLLRLGWINRSALAISAGNASRPERDRAMAAATREIGAPTVQQITTWLADRRRPALFERIRDVARARNGREDSTPRFLLAAAERANAGSRCVHSMPRVAAEMSVERRPAAASCSRTPVLQGYGGASEGGRRPSWPRTDAIRSRLIHLGDRIIRRCAGRCRLPSRGPRTWSGGAGCNRRRRARERTPSRAFGVVARSASAYDSRPGSDDSRVTRHRADSGSATHKTRSWPAGSTDR